MWILFPVGSIWVWTYSCKLVASQIFFGLIAITSLIVWWLVLLNTVINRKAMADHNMSYELFKPSTLVRLHNRRILIYDSMYHIFGNAGTYIATKPVCEKQYQIDKSVTDESTDDNLDSAGYYNTKIELSVLVPVAALVASHRGSYDQCTGAFSRLIY